MKPMQLPFVLRADGSAQLGIGHVKRCLLLAKGLAKRGATAVLVMRPADVGVVSLVEDAGVPFHVLPEDTRLAQEPAALDALGLPPAAALVLDVSHRETLREAAAVPTYFAALAARFRPLIVIDSLFDECLVGQFDLPVDLAVIPYTGAEGQEIASPAARLALGPAYFPLEAAFGPRVGQAPKVRAEASRILVTSGGGDGGGFSEKALAALQSIEDRRLEIRLVIGPVFEAETRQSIARLVAASRHRVRLLDAPANLAAPMAWCDLAVASTGLTKYALAATGTPAILLSHYADQAAPHHPFERLGSARYIGVAGEVPIPALAAAVRALLQDAGARQRMADAGSSVVDGHGTDRTVDSMFEVAETAMRFAPAPQRRLAR